jgi:hypothetical protein
MMKAKEMHYFSTLFDKELYMFQTDLLSVIICHTSYVAVTVLTSLADGNITSMINTSCWEYSIKTPDDGQ